MFVLDVPDAIEEIWETVDASPVTSPSTVTILIGVARDAFFAYLLYSFVCTLIIDAKIQ